MSDELVAFRQQFAVIRDRFMADATQKLEAVMAMWEPSAFQATVKPDIEGLFRLSHNFSGSGASFGLNAFSERARLLEFYVQSMLDQEQGCSARQASRIHDQLLRLRNELHCYTATDAVVEPALPPRTSRATTSRLVFLVDDDASQSSELALQLSFLNFEVRTFSSPELACEAIAQTEPAALLMDVVFPEGPLAGPNWVQAMTHRLPPIPLVFLSIRQDFESRLAAFRAGGTHYLTKPVDIRKLADTLDELTLGTVSGAYRVLVVDDEPQQAALNALILEQAGMVTCVVNHPAEVLAVLDRFRPDLLLTDLYMPDCGGAELAGLLRQHPNYGTLPIIFLSSEDRFDKKQEALRLGGEDFLSKPVSPHELVALVGLRAQRARQVHGLSTELASLLREYESQKFALNQHLLLFFTDPEGNVTFANARMLELTGKTLVDFLGTSLKAAHRRKFYPESLWQTLDAGKVWHGKLRHAREDGREYWLQLTVVPTRDREERISSFIWVAHDVTALQIEKNELREEKSRLEGQLKAKQDMLAFTSHEMRGSLNGLAGMARLLERTHLDREQREFVDAMNTAADHLIAVINQTLDFTKIEAGRLELEIRPFDLGRLLESVGELLAATAHEKRLQFILEIDPALPLTVDGDGMRLRQILLNLISNAIKFTEVGHVCARISVLHAEAEQVQVRIEVEDSGIGIPRERQHLLFKFFSQADIATSRKYGGTGLGLAIASRLVASMMGNLQVESASGEGARFWFDLTLPCPSPATLGNDLAGKKCVVVCPLLESGLAIQSLLKGLGGSVHWFKQSSQLLDHLAEMPDVTVFVTLEDVKVAARLAEKVQTLHREARLILLITSHQIERAKGLLASGYAAYLILPLRRTAVIEALTQLDQPGDAPNMEDVEVGEAVFRARSNYHILVAEDNPVNRRILSTVLTNGGFSNQSVPDGQACLQHLENNHVDLILMDCHMPVMDGFTALAAIRADPRWCRIPVLAISGEDRKDPESRSALAQFNHHFLKPVNPVDLFRVLDSYLLHETAVSMPRATGHDQPIELSRFKALTQGDVALEHSLVEMFLLSVNRELVGLEAALRREDLHGVLQFGHSIKGASLELGAQDLAHIAGRLEYYGGHGQLDAAFGLLASLHSEYQRVRSFLEEHLRRPNPSTPSPRGTQ